MESPYGKSPSCLVRFGQPRAAVRTDAGQPVLGLALPVLAGAGEEILLPRAAATEPAGVYTVFQAGSSRAGLAVAPDGADLEEAAGQLYRGLFAAAAGLHLYRIWNYVPAINAEANGLENYRRFCRGRSLAFEEHYGRGFQRRLPAASAVGADAGPLAVGFLAGQTEPIFCENPWQVPAFEYPMEHGPRPPSFSRATVAQVGSGRRIFISGTAAIRGHRTVSPHDLNGQLACTLENLAAISGAAAEKLGPGDLPPAHRTFKVYLRRAEDLAPVAERLQRELLRPGDAVSYLRADLCREELLVEIEAAFG